MRSDGRTGIKKRATNWPEALREPVVLVDPLDEVVERRLVEVLAKEVGGLGAALVLGEVDEALVGRLLVALGLDRRDEVVVIEQRSGLGLGRGTPPTR